MRLDRGVRERMSSPYALSFLIVLLCWSQLILAASSDVDVRTQADRHCTTTANANENVVAAGSCASEASVSSPTMLTNEVVPSRSGVFPTNLILEEGGEVNPIGQRPISNSVDVSFTLHPNGDGLGDGIKIDSPGFNHIDEVIAKYCCDLMNMTQSRCESNSGARLVTETGVRMLSFNDVEDGQRVYCVPQGVHFVWPLKKTGYVVYPKNVVGPIPGKPIRLKQLSERPRVFSVDNFVSPEEVKEILQRNIDRVKPSEVGFGGWQDDTRTSSTSWDDDTEAAKAIRTRTFQILAMDEDLAMSDTLQVLRYTSDGYKGQGEWYKPHVDWFGADSYDGHDPLVNNGSNRFATMFLYLSDVEQGGATVFPLSTTHEGYNGEKLVHDGTVDTPGYINTLEARYCCNESSTALRSKPVRGNAVLFYGQGPDGALDPYSLHGGCPPLKGTKWSANVWIWNRKSPDKSQAKDMPTGNNDSRAVSFLNTRSHPLVIYWDGQSSSMSSESIEVLTKEFREDTSNERFVKQITVPSRRELELSSYESHEFIAVDPATNEVVWRGQVASTGQLFEI